MGEWARLAVADLERAGTLLVQDGNHGNDRPRPGEFVPEGVAFIRAADMRGGRVDFSGAERINETAARRIRKGIGRPGDVLLSHKGTVGRVAFAPDDSPPFVCSPQTTFWRSLDQNQLDRDYLRFFLESPDFVRQLDSRKSESDMAPYVSLTEQRRLTVVLPPVTVQREIAGVLGALAAKIESNRRLVNRCSGLLAALSESLGAENWVALGELASSTRSMVDPQTLGAAAVDHLSIPAFDAVGLPDRCAARSIQSGKFEVREESILVSRLNPSTPRIWHVAPTKARALCSTEFLVLRPAGGVALGALWLAVISQEFLDELARRATGTSFSHQRVRSDDAMSVEVPDVRGVDREIAEESEDLLRVALRARRESATLAALRDALLPELLSGRLRVREAEKVIEGVV